MIIEILTLFAMVSIVGGIILVLSMGAESIGTVVGGILGISMLASGGMPRHSEPEPTAPKRLEFFLDIDGSKGIFCPHCRTSLFVYPTSLSGQCPACGTLINLSYVCPRTGAHFRTKEDHDRNDLHMRMFHRDYTCG